MSERPIARDAGLLIAGLLRRRGAAAIDNGRADRLALHPWRRGHLESGAAAIARRNGMRAVCDRPESPVAKGI